MPESVALNTTGKWTVPLRHRQKATLGFYFHFPFCPHLCPYCDFIKTDKFTRRDVLDHQSWMVNELDELLSGAQGEGAQSVTVYFGGGTPGLFWGSTFRPIIEKISSRWPIEECTLEANPNMISPAKIASWREAGIDRLTLGVQSLHPHILRFLGRRHSPEQALTALLDARSAGFSQVQVDFIYGLPGECGERKIVDELDQIGRAGATGVSLYALTVEPTTQFGVSGVRPDDDTAIAEYRLIREACDKWGFIQRETSNFSRFETKHNNLYWHGYPYFGFGSGAHGLLSPERGRPFGQRYRYGPSVDDEDRIQLTPGRDELMAQKTESPYRTRHFEPPRSWNELFNELTFSLLRTPEGIPGQWVQSFADRLEWSAIEQDAVLRRGLDQGCLIQTPDGGIRLSLDEMIRGDLWHSRLVGALGTLS